MNTDRIRAREKIGKRNLNPGSGRRRRRRVLCCRLLSGALAVCLAAGIGVWKGNSGTEKEEEHLPMTAYDMEAKEVGAMNIPVSARTYSIADDLYGKYQDLLILVNKQNPLDSVYESSLRWICDGRLQIQEIVYEDLVDMLKAGEEAGHTYWIASAYRSRERQEELMEAEIEKNMRKGLSREEARKKSEETLMEPGCSEHETGLALDILVSENVTMDIHQAEEPGNQWLCEHAWEYGFVLRYPEDKTDLTGINYEPWHFRYVGKEMAEYMQREDLCLEEFYELVSSSVLK